MLSFLKFHIILVLDRLRDVVRSMGNLSSVCNLLLPWQISDRPTTFSVLSERQGVCE